jgi:aminoglycoside phosphotransferase (APT) family kinase protein
MAVTVQELRDWLITLPPFEGVGGETAVQLTRVSFTESWTLYIAEWEAGRAVLKHFADDGRQPAAGTRPASDRAAAEAAALRTFGPRGLAPELLWEGALPGDMDGHAVIYPWVEGNAVVRRRLLDPEVGRYADALAEVHSEPVEIKMRSPQPHSLDSWWSETHARYRELPTGLIEEMPPGVSEALGRLVQSISADAQAHKRFWEGVELVPVHGGPLPHNFILNGERPTLVDWHRFGLGDPAYEVASVSCVIEPFAGEQAADELVLHYLDRLGNLSLSRRLEVYRRVWPFSRLVSLLANSWNLARGEGRAGTPATTLAYWAPTLAYNLRACMRTYGWPGAVADRTAEEARRWVSGISGVGGRGPGVGDRSSAASRPSAGEERPQA